MILEHFQALIDEILNNTTDQLPRSRRSPAGGSLQEHASEYEDGCQLK